MLFSRHFNEQLALMADGNNAKAHQLLQHADVDLIRNHLNRDERICAYATGRTVSVGRTLWVVTTHSLLVANTGKVARVRKFPLGSIEHADIEKGRYGHGLSVLLSGARLGLYGASHAFAVLALRALNRPAAKEATQALAQTPLTEEAQSHALHAFADLTLRAQPLLAQSDAEAKNLLQATAARAKAEGQFRAPEAV